MDDQNPSPASVTREGLDEADRIQCSSSRANLAHPPRLKIDKVTREEIANLWAHRVTYASASTINEFGKEIDHLSKLRLIKKYVRGIWSG